jgi:hypothetical protein
VSHLRRIALTVEQDDPGHFHWLILESVNDIVVYDKEVNHADEAGASLRGVEDGVEAIKRHFNGELKDGPREMSEGLVGRPADPPAPSESQVVWSPS